MFRRQPHRSTLALLLGLSLLPAGHALDDGNTESTIDPKVVAIDERAYLGVRLAGTYRLRDANGELRTLDAFRGKPLILLFSYYTCDGLCGTINRHLQTLIDGVTRFRAGEDFAVLTVSFDRNDDVAWRSWTIPQTSCR